jgi:hypothetical protein
MWFAGLPSSLIMRATSEDESIPVLDQYTGEMVPTPRVMYHWRMGNLDLGRTPTNVINAIAIGRLSALGLQLMDYEGSTLIGTPIPISGPVNSIPVASIMDAHTYVSNALSKVGIRGETISIFYLQG